MRALSRDLVEIDHRASLTRYTAEEALRLMDAFDNPSPRFKTGDRIAPGHGRDCVEPEVKPEWKAGDRVTLNGMLFHTIGEGAHVDLFPSKMGWRLWPQVGDWVRLSGTELAGRVEAIESQYAKVHSIALWLISNLEPALSPVENPEAHPFPCLKCGGIEFNNWKCTRCGNVQEINVPLAKPVTMDGPHWYAAIIRTKEKHPLGGGGDMDILRRDIDLREAARDHDKRIAALEGK